MSQIYEIYYPEYNVRQKKVMIKRLWWTYSKLLSEKGQKRCIKSITKGMEWFTDQSPLSDAITTGKVKIYNGEYVPCEVNKI